MSFCKNISGAFICNFFSRIRLRHFRMSPSWRCRTPPLKLHPLLVKVTSIHSCPVCSSRCLFEKVSVQKVFTVLHTDLLWANFFLSTNSEDAFDSVLLQFQCGWHTWGSDLTQRLRWWMCRKTCNKTCLLCKELLTHLQTHVPYFKMKQELTVSRSEVNETIVMHTWWRCRWNFNATFKFSSVGNKSL